MTIYYAADLIYITRAGTELTTHVEFIDFQDVTEYCKLFMEFLSDFDYTLLRCDIKRGTRIITTDNEEEKHEV